MRTITEQHQQFGSYRLLHLLDSGGFADVYLAEHIYLKTLYAVKVLQIHVFDEDQQQRFLDEARIIARLYHPHIIQVIDYGVEHATPFLVMSYAPHGNLRQLHPEGLCVPLETVVHYVKQVAGALQYAHDRHLIHRDIKPENLLLDVNDELMLSDFGIAIVARSSHSQSLQDVVGTANYMPPEQLKGHPRPASDQYALATLAYEWLCGAPPFEGDTYLDIAKQHLSAPVPLLTEKIPGIPPSVAAVITRALAKDSHQRFENVQAFADALEQAYLLGALPAPAPVSDLQAQESEHISDLRAEQPREGRRRSRRFVLAMLGGIGTLAAEGGYLGWRAFFGSRPQSRSLSHRQVGSLPTLASRIGKTVFIYNGLSNTKIDHFEIDTLGWSPDSTRIISAGSSSVSSPLVGILTGWHAFTGKDLFTNTTYTGVGVPGFGHGQGAAWSPDGTRIAATTSYTITSASFYTGPGSLFTGVHIMDAATGKRLQLWPVTCEALAWSPDGKSLALVGPYLDPTITESTPSYIYKTPRIMIVDTSTGSSVLTHYAESIYSNYSVLAWSPDSRYVASCSDGVHVWDALSAQSISYYPGSTSVLPGFALAWSPNGQVIASGWGSEVHISSASTGKHVFTYKGHGQTVRAIAWSPDGSLIATGGEDDTIQLWNATNGNLLYTYRKHTASILTLAWSPDGGFIVSGSASADGTVRIWTVK